MGVSEVLSAAVQSLDEYERHGAYEGCEREISVAKDVISAVRLLLEAIPFGEPEHQNRIDELEAAIQTLDTSRLRAATASLLEYYQYRDAYVES
ncbi:MAG: hypothetical protein HUU20_12740 [Pirellulales bacterium]|nr:hypothetical protein [Pirellulales bacterium]